MRLRIGALRPRAPQTQVRSAYGDQLYYGRPCSGAQRGRQDSVPELALSFLSAVAAPDGPSGFTAAAMRQLRRHPWSGGAHELRRVVEVAAAVCDGEVLDEMTVAFALKTGASERSVRV